MKKIFIVLGMALLFLINAYAALAVPVEPKTCGNGIIDDKESYLNCNKDVKVEAQHYYSCMSEGKEECVYYQLYSSFLKFFAFLIIIGGTIIWYLTKPPKTI
tara:strand:- start:680 stop:985 length:306 start_codon:yes stop_codon:yes gene_type:complete